MEDLSLALTVLSVVGVCFFFFQRLLPDPILKLRMIIGFGGCSTKRVSSSDSLGSSRVITDLIFFGGMKGSRVPPFLHFLMGKMSPEQMGTSLCLCLGLLLLRW